MERIVTLKCMGDIDGPRFLDGRTGDGTVGLAPSIEGFTGTRWKFHPHGRNTSLECMGDIDGPRFLNVTFDGIIQLAPHDGLSGTRWKMVPSGSLESSQFIFVNQGDIPGPRFLDGRTGDGTVGMVYNDLYTGTKWEINDA